MENNIKNLNNNLHLDIIGDIHGHATKLINLLEKMGYIEKNGTYEHPEKRQVVFLGDYIDRGDEQEKTINIVRNMVENGSAYAIMGNHELNAILYSMKVGNSFLRVHSKGNKDQHESFLNEYPFHSEKHLEIIEWFKTLPVFLEIENARFVHASWVNRNINYLKSILNSDNTIKDHTYLNFSDRSHPDTVILEMTMKGLEMKLPNKIKWADNHGIERDTLRINWFLKKENPTYKNSALSIPSHVDLPNIPIPEKDFFYSDNEVVFFGHYWMKGDPKIDTIKCVCLDYSAGKGGQLTGYRFDGELNLSNEKFIY